jgi:hypothetical protein
MEYDTKTRESAVLQVTSGGVVCKHLWAMQCLCTLYACLKNNDADQFMSHCSPVSDI